ncbi:MAG: alpha-amylase, partial [Myxococcales bacterium]|nr:alpha-amylase [Myxococcales bacterium]
MTLLPRTRTLLAALTVVAVAVPTLLGSCVTVEPTVDHTTQVTDWRDEIIYQIVVDRFEDGDRNNNYNVDYRKDAAYHGGDWQGIIDRLDYIETLGVTTLWISPVVKNVEEDAGFASYHGYWTQDFLAVNPHFGDLRKLQQLVEACHARGIKVVLDIVTNHVGQLFYYDINRNGQPDIVFFGGGGPGSGSQNRDQPSDLRRASEWDPEYDSRGVQSFTSLGENGLAPVVWVEQPEINRTPPNPPEFRNPRWYNRKGRVTVWESGGGDFDYVREQEILGDFPGGLKDLATDRDDVRQALIRVFQYWIEVAGFDGFRIDTLKHVEPAFFDIFAPAMRAHAKRLGKRNFFMFGEAFDGNDDLLGSYTHGQGVDSVFYFSAKYRVFDDVFGRGAPTANIQRLFEQRSELVDGRPRYNDQPKTDGPTDADGNGLSAQQLMVHFIDNHDVPRFLYSFPDVRVLRNALVYQLTIDGIPCIYYGTEQDFAGGPDPANREDMWSSGFRTDGETFRHMQRLIQLRKKYAPLRRGDVTFRWSTEHTADEPDAGIVAFERAYQGQRVLVVINSHDTRTSSTGDGTTVMQTGFPAGTEV